MKAIVRWSLLLLLGLLAGGTLGGAALAQATLPAGLIGPTWELTAIQRAPSDSKTTAGAGVTLQFGADGRASGQSTCNGYSATAQAGGSATLSFGPVLATKRACVDPDRTAIETEYFIALESVSTYNLNGSQLQLVYNNGQSLLEYRAASVPGMPTTGGPSVTPWLFAVGAGLALALVLSGFLVRRVLHTPSPRR